MANVYVCQGVAQWFYGNRAVIAIQNAIAKPELTIRRLESRSWRFSEKLTKTDYAK